LQAYREEGIEVWGVTPQNEPGDGYEDWFHIPSCGYSPEEERKFIADNLGPTLKEHNFGDVVIMNGDDQRKSIPDRQNVVSAYADTLRGSSCAVLTKSH
jgi:glucosylceramidase